MSRLDIFTIAVVVICVAAIVFLLYRTTDLFKSKDALTEGQNTESLYEDDGTTGDDYSDDPYYSDTTASEFDFLSDTTEEAAPASTTAKPATTTTPPATTTKPATTTTPPATKPSAPAATKPAPAPAESKPLENIDEMSSSGGNYLVLAGAFTVMSNAEAHARRLEKMGFSNAKVALFNKGKYATVLVDRFESKSEASALVNRLTEKGVESYVQTKR
jgi:cell division protein FtsN